jgi:hypothetical protein
MKMSLHDIDQQIREVENRIAVERIELEQAVHGCTNSLREAVTSPKTLLALLGVGYAVGKLVFKDNKPAAGVSTPAKKAGVLGLLTGVAGTALSMAGPRLGWSAVAKWAANRYFSSRNNKSGAAATAGGTRTAPGYPTGTPTR